MKKQIAINSIILFFILFCFLFLLTGCSSEDENLVSKAEEEIKYLEKRIISMMNTLNHITLSDTILIEEKTKKETTNSQEGSQNQQSNSGASQGEENSSNNLGSNSSSNSEQSEGNTSKESTKYEIKNDSILVNNNKTIDWDYIKGDIEDIHSAWATLTIDLHSLNVNNEEILNFSDVLDKVTITIKQEDKIATLNNLASLYAFFPSYIKQISDDNDKINIDYTKTCILNSYALVEQNKWEEMKLQVTNGINYFTNILNNVDGEIKNQNKISKVYVLLNELNNSIDLKDKDLYLIKYKNVMDELVNI